MIFVDGISSKKLCSGLEFTVYGGFFDASCRVKFGSVTAVVDTFSESFITVVVPEVSGSVNATIEDGAGHSINLGNVSVGPMNSVQTYNYIRDYKITDFIEYILGLFPSGRLFDFSEGSVWRKLVNAAAYCLHYLWSLIQSLIQALDPFQTENFGEWERELGLPEVGISPETDDARRREIYRVGFSKGGCSINYYKRILALMNVEADIFEYTKNPERFEGVVFGDDDPNFYMMIRFRVPLLNLTYFRAGESRAGERVMDYVNLRIETVFERVKQAHIKIIYSYLTQQEMYIMTSLGYRIVTSEGAPLVAFCYPE